MTVAERSVSPQFQDVGSGRGLPEEFRGERAYDARMQPSVDEIGAMQDPVIRNLWITQRYHEFAIGLRDAGLGADATWCAFAVWASKTAGATIRGEVLPRRVEELLQDNTEVQGVLHRFNHGIVAWAARHLSHDHLVKAVKAVTKDVSAQIAAGNVMVFKELGPLFTGLLDAVHSSSPPKTPKELADRLAPALDTLGNDSDTAVVVEAFGAYGEALFESDVRPALVLQANTLAVSHEQRRLQPAIAGALDAAISDTLKKVVEVDVVTHLPSAEVRHLLDGLTNDVCGLLDTAWDTALTESIMQLVTSNETFDLRDSVPRLPTGMFPPALSDLTGTPAEAAVSQWDKTGGTGDPSGAHDWEQLDERMNFIVNLFRSRQQVDALFEPPFSKGQLDDLAKGKKPEEPL
jgi:hypothetical protein